MRALFVSGGDPILLPIVVMLAGVTLSCDGLSTEARMIRRTTAVAVAQFFHHFASGGQGYLAAGKDRTGILEDVSKYFGVVENNGGMHLHTLVWLAGNLGFATLRDQIRHRHDHRRHRRRIRTDVGHRLAASLTVHSEAGYTVTPMRLLPDGRCTVRGKIPHA